ncbi:MAG TPA: hypothetical protein VFS81_00485 [Candidatus Binatia bacterium]|nr:hypothetical protein [Candidatus Binatia bacterium]
MMIVLGHFLIAAAAVIATSAIIGYFLTKLLLRLLQMVDRLIRLYRVKVSAFFASPHLTDAALKRIKELLPQSSRKKFGLSTQTRLHHADSQQNQVNGKL